MRLKLLTCLLAIHFISGCASPPPPYKLAEGASHAHLQSALRGAYDRQESIDVYLEEGKCSSMSRQQLFTVRKSISRPEGGIKVLANKPLQLVYDESASGGRSCHIEMAVTLEAGKNYSLIGGFDYKEGPIPVLLGTRMCRFGVKDNASGKLLPSSSEAICSK